MVTEPIGDQRRCAGAKKRVEHRAALGAAGEGARFDQGRRVGCEVCLGIGCRRDRPDRALVGTLVLAKDRIELTWPAGLALRRIRSPLAS